MSELRSKLLITERLFGSKTFMAFSKIEHFLIIGLRLFIILIVRTYSTNCSNFYGYRGIFHLRSCMICIARAGLALMKQLFKTKFSQAVYSVTLTRTLTLIISACGVQPSPLRKDRDIYCSPSIF